MFESVEIVEERKLYLHVELSSDYYPNEASARFEIRWYRNDDFNVHTKRNDRTVRGSVDGTGIRTHTTREITSIRHRPLAALTPRMLSGRTIIAT